MGVDLTRNFFLSYTYRLTHTLQHNHTDAQTRRSHQRPPDSSSSRPFTCPSPLPHSSSSYAYGAGVPDSSSCMYGGSGDDGGFDPTGLDVFEGSMFAWNAHLTRPLRVAAGSAKWTVALIHGFWEQRQVGGGWINDGPGLGVGVGSVWGLVVFWRIGGVLGGW